MVTHDWINELDTAIHLELGFAMSELDDRKDYRDLAYGAGLPWMRKINYWIYRNEAVADDIKEDDNG